jgi:hypothetical protein
MIQTVNVSIAVAWTAKLFLGLACAALVSAGGGCDANKYDALYYAWRAGHEVAGPSAGKAAPQPRDAGAVDDDDAAASGDDASAR